MQIIIGGRKVEGPVMLKLIKKNYEKNSRLCNCKNPPIHYIVFATPHKKKYLLQNSQSADWLFYFVKITKKV